MHMLMRTEIQATTRRTAIVTALSVALLVALFAVPCNAADATRNSKIKEAYLYNFLKYMEFPDSAVSGSPITIGILGDDPFGAALTPITSRTYQGKSIRIKQLAQISDADDCQMVFVCASERGNVSKILSALKGRAVITVSEIDGFVESGGVINLLVIGNRVKFEINQRAAREAGIKISSELLKLATSVKT